MNNCKYLYILSYICVHFAVTISLMVTKIISSSNPSNAKDDRIESINKNYHEDDKIFSAFPVESLLF